MTIVSNSDVFMRLGNPWVSERDRIKLRGPEIPVMLNGVAVEVMACDRRRQKPLLAAESGQRVVADAARIKANALHKMHSKLIKSKHSRLLTK